MNSPVYVLDTDILSIHQSEAGAEYERLRKHLDGVDPRLVFVSIVSFQEQALGWNSYLQQAKKLESLIRGYAKFQRMLLDFTRLNILAFDQDSLKELESLKAAGVQVGAMDLRIAAVALANECTLVTRNTVDFERVPGLRIEDWTIA